MTGTCSIGSAQTSPCERLVSPHMGRAGTRRPSSVVVVVVRRGRRNDLAAAVVPARRADAMRTPGAVTLRARVVDRRSHLVLGAPLGGARVGLLLLGDGHRSRKGSAARHRAHVVLRVSAQFAEGLARSRANDISMSELELDPALLETLRTLQQHDVEFVLVGDVAEAIHNN